MPGETWYGTPRSVFRQTTRSPIDDSMKAGAPGWRQGGGIHSRTFAEVQLSRRGQADVLGEKEQRRHVTCLEHGVFSQVSRFVLPVVNEESVFPHAGF